MYLRQWTEESPLSANLEFSRDESRWGRSPHLPSRRPIEDRAVNKRGVQKNIRTPLAVWESTLLEQTRRINLTQASRYSRTSPLRPHRPPSGVLRLDLCGCSSSCSPAEEARHDTRSIRSER